MQVLAEGLTLTERNFLTACVAHYTAQEEGPLPVIHEKPALDKPLTPLDRLPEVLKVALSSESDRGTVLSAEERGVTLNGLQLLKPTPGAKRKSCSCSERKCLRELFVNSEAAVTEAWRAADPVTGFSILQLGLGLRTLATWFGLVGRRD